ncbi:MAG: sulfate adenylyltransferase [Gammaproteobacteria bacterium RIFCSPLOWO2_02_FULL_61_13]|nr:MAG: sulfate adenylyltransferase [Gammaproteobacteria bacterium RIFCSPLOWO2_02_FULL_61_13]
MTQPHGGVDLNPLYVADAAQRSALAEAAGQLPSLLVNSAAAANAVMLGAGYFSPLPGYMNKADALSVARDMHTVGGLFWPVPCLNLSNESIGRAESIALRDPNVEGNPVLAVQEVQSVETLSDDELRLITEKVFGTLDPKHPGVATLVSLGRQMISGPIRVLNYSYFEQEFPDTFRTAPQIRKAIADAGWNKVVAFQTRNPMHRAHEELCKMAQESVQADGVLIHMLLGKLKAGDIPAEVRDAAIRKMVDLYFPRNTVMVTGYGFDMLYAGPREAVLHAVFRQNAGCSHLIVGRDHAGVGSYYGPFDAQTIFDTQVPETALRIEIFRADNTAFSRKLGRVVMMRDAPDHTPEDFVQLSGTKVRELLASGQPLPPEFARPEVANILMEYYQREGS